MYTGYYQKFHIFDDKLNNEVASWMFNLKNQTVWIKNLAYSIVFGKAIKRNMFKYFGKTQKHWYWCQYPYSALSPPLKTVVTLTIFKSSGNISISSDKSNINFKEAYNSPKRFSTTLKLILLQPQHLGRCSLSVSLFLPNDLVLSKIALLNSYV